MKSISIAFIVLFFFVNHMSAAKKEEEVWHLVQQEKGFLLWKLKSNPHIIGTVQSENLERTIDWNNVKSENVFKDMADKKKKILSLINVSNWTASRYSWEKRNHYHELMVEGLYVDHRFQETSFWEYHLFFPKQIHQILIIVPKSEAKDMYPSVIENFVNRAKKTLTVF